LAQPEQGQIIVFRGYLESHARFPKLLRSHESSAGTQERIVNHLLRVFREASQDSVHQASRKHRRVAQLQFFGGLAEIIPDTNRAFSPLLAAEVIRS
jgi:hypothetical protein